MGYSKMVSETKWKVDVWLVDGTRDSFMTTNNQVSTDSYVKWGNRYYSLFNMLKWTVKDMSVG